MGDEDDPRGRTPGRRERLHRLPNPSRHGSHEPRVIVKLTKANDRRRARPDHRPRTGEVFPILPAPRIRVVGGSEKGVADRHTVGGHRGERLRQERVPIAVPPIHRQMWRELVAQCSQQQPVLSVDGAHPTESLVTLGHLREALGGDVAPARHVAQEGLDIRRTLRTTEADQQQRTVPREGGHNGDPDRDRCRRATPSAGHPTGPHPPRNRGGQPGRPELPIRPAEPTRRTG